MSEKPVVAWARPSDARVAWMAYVGEKIAVRELNNGTVQIKTGHDDWRDAE